MEASRVDTPTAADYLGLSRNLLEKLRWTGGGPVHEKLGRQVVYRIKDLEEWAARNRRRSTSDPGPGVAR